jgi:hypothetical protein
VSIRFFFHAAPVPAHLMTHLQIPGILFVQNFFLKAAGTA